MNKIIKFHISFVVFTTSVFYIAKLTIQMLYKKVASYFEVCIDAWRIKYTVLYN